MNPYVAGFVETAVAIRPSRLVSGDVYDFLRRGREFHVRFGDGRGMTLFYGVITRDHRLSCSYTGHCQPMLVDQSGVRRLGAGRAPSDRAGHDVYKEESIPIAKGDTLVVFNDGRSAADRDHREFEDARILDIVTRPAARLRQGYGGQATAAAIRDRLVNAVTDFTRGSCQRDDMAVLVVRYLE
jgi:serine phosphatase RsbU (regulator of sigma subunit)